MRVFISGVIQGSRPDLDHLHGQDYRYLITEAVRARHPEAEVIDPWEIHPNAATYGPEKARQTLMEEIELAATSDVLIAYVPEASMGSALEMWAAYQAGALIFSITGMPTNWAILSLSTQVYPTLDDSLASVGDGGLSQTLDGLQSAR